MSGTQRRIVVLTLALALTAPPALGAARHHKKQHKPAAAGLTRAQVIALIKQYAPAAVAGAPGLQGPRGPTGPTGVAGSPGPTSPYSAGAGLLLSGSQFSLNPASTLFQDPLAAPQCPAYTFLYRLTQAGATNCDFGTVAFTGVAPGTSLSGTNATVMSTTVYPAAPRVLVTGNIVVQGSNTAVPDTLVCTLSLNGTAGYAGFDATLPAFVSPNVPYVDMPVTASFANVPAGSTIGPCATSPAAATRRR